MQIPKAPDDLYRVVITFDAKEDADVARQTCFFQLRDLNKIYKIKPRGKQRVKSITIEPFNKTKLEPKGPSPDRDKRSNRCNRPKSRVVSQHRVS